ncbi:MAG: hypothetical protein QM589_12765 [Thermomicrobiales bacterium]
MTPLEVVGNFSNIAGAVSGIAALIGVIRLLRTQARGNEIITVILRMETSERREVELPLQMLRRDVSRMELLGRIGMLPMKNKGDRFSIDALATPEFMQQLNKVAEGKTSRLTIPITEEEFDQFILAKSE